MIHPTALRDTYAALRERSQLHLVSSSWSVRVQSAPSYINCTHRFPHDVLWQGRIGKPILTLVSPWVWSSFWHTFLGLQTPHPFRLDLMHAGRVGAAIKMCKGHFLWMLLISPSP